MGKYRKIAIKGIAKGLTSAGGAIKSAISKPISAAKAAIVAGFSAAKDRAVSYMNKLKDGVKNKINSAKDTVKNAVNKIKGFFPLSVGRILTGIKLPHFSVSGKAPFGLGGKGTKPSISVSWYKKAYDTPYLFDRPTVINGLGFGDGVGDEMVYGKNALMGDIEEAMQKGGGKTVNITNYNYFTGVEDQEVFMQKFVKKMETQMRTA